MAARRGRPGFLVMSARALSDPVHGAGTGARVAALRRIRRGVPRLVDTVHQG